MEFDGLMLLRFVVKYFLVITVVEIGEGGCSSKLFLKADALLLREVNISILQLVQQDYSCFLEVLEGVRKA